MLSQNVCIKYIVPHRSAFTSLYSVLNALWDLCALPQKSRKNTLEGFPKDRFRDIRRGETLTANNKWNPENTRLSSYMTYASLDKLHKLCTSSSSSTKLGYWDYLSHGSYAQSVSWYPKGAENQRYSDVSCFAVIVLGKEEKERAIFVKCQKWKLAFLWTSAIYSIYSLQSFFQLSFFPFYIWDNR
jgi:hypothetical protein